MKTLKTKTGLQLIVITLLFSSCTNLKHSNFNRQKYLRLKQQETSFSIKADKVEEVHVVENSFVVIHNTDTTVETTTDVPANINLVQNESNLVNAADELNVTSTINKSAKTIERDLKNENDVPELYDTLYYKSGLVKPCIIHSWDDKFVTCSYPVRGVMTERIISISTMDCFVDYDSLNQFQYESENCSPEHSVKNKTEDKISEKEIESLTILFFILIMLISTTLLIAIVTGEYIILVGLGVFPVLVIVATIALIILIRKQRQKKLIK